MAPRTSGYTSISQDENTGIHLEKSVGRNLLVLPWILHAVLLALYSLLFVFLHSRLLKTYAASDQVYCTGPYSVPGSGL